MRAYCSRAWGERPSSSVFPEPAPTSLPLVPAEIAAGDDGGMPGNGSTTCGRQFGEMRDGYLGLGAAPARATASALTSRQTRRHTFKAAFAVSLPPSRPVTPSRAIAATRLGQDCSPLSNPAAT